MAGLFGNSASAPYAVAQAQQPDAVANQMFGGGGGLYNGLISLFSGMSPQAGQLFMQQQMMRAIGSDLASKGYSPAQIGAFIQNPDVMKYYSGVPINNGIAESPNGAKVPVISTAGNNGQYLMPQDPAMRAAMTGAPVKLGEGKFGDMSGPVLYQNGQTNAVIPFVGNTLPGPIAQTGQAQPPAAAQSPVPAPIGPGGQQPPAPGNAQPGQVSGLQGAIDLQNNIAQQKAAATARGTELGKNQGALPKAIPPIDQTIANIDEIANDKRVPEVLGRFNGQIPAEGIPIHGPFGTKATIPYWSADEGAIINKIDQLKGQVYGAAAAANRGNGFRTQFEFQQVGNGIANLSRATTPEAFKAALLDLRGKMQALRDATVRAAGGEPTQQHPAEQKAAPSNNGLPPGWTLKVR